MVVDTLEVNKWPIFVETLEANVAIVEFVLTVIEDGGRWLCLNLSNKIECFYNFADLILVAEE
jgi:hypothetical protein